MSMHIGVFILIDIRITILLFTAWLNERPFSETALDDIRYATFSIDKLPVEDCTPAAYLTVTLDKPVLQHPVGYLKYDSICWIAK